MNNYQATQIFYPNNTVTYSSVPQQVVYLHHSYQYPTQIYPSYQVPAPVYQYSANYYPPQSVAVTQLVELNQSCLEHIRALEMRTLEKTQFIDSYLECFYSNPFNRRNLYTRNILTWLKNEMTELTAQLASELRDHFSSNLGPMTEELTQRNFEVIETLKRHILSVDFITRPLTTSTQAELQIIDALENYIIIKTYLTENLQAAHRPNDQSNLSTGINECDREIENLISILRPMVSNDASNTVTPTDQTSPVNTTSSFSQGTTETNTPPSPAPNLNLTQVEDFSADRNLPAWLLSPTGLGISVQLINPHPLQQQSPPLPTASPFWPLTPKPQSPTLHFTTPQDPNSPVANWPDLRRQISDVTINNMLTLNSPSHQVTILPDVAMMSPLSSPIKDQEMMDW